MEFGLNWSATMFELSQHVEVARIWLQAGLQPARKQDGIMKFGLKQVTDRFEIS